jgi:20S proteasome alpha/beta subunit
MKYSLLIFLFFGAKSYSQELPKIHGTIIIGAIVNDSIVMVADSRVIIGVVGEDANCRNSYAYIDSLPKIFKLKDFLISFAGIGDFGGKQIFSVVNDFNKAYPNKMDFQTTVFKFQDYIDKIYPLAKYPNVKPQFLVAGFNNGKPQMIIFNRTTKKASKELFSSRNGMLSSDSLISGYFSKSKPHPFDCENVSTLMEDAIYKFAKDKNNQCIGGPLEIVKSINPNIIHWLKNDFSKKVYSYSKLLALIKSGKIALNPIIKNGRDKAIKLLEDEIK